MRDRDQSAALERILGAAPGPRQELARIFPSLEVNGRNFRARGLAENVEIARFPAASPLPRIEFYTTPDPKPAPDAQFAPGSDWGALRLLQRGAVRRADGKEWDAVVRLRDRGSELVLAVTVVFEQPLPALDRWPAPSE
jgi:hypothetical protein